MAIYTAATLKSDGTPNEVLTGTKTFTFSNPASGSAYFIFETDRTTSGSYNYTSAKNAIGTYASFSPPSMSLVTSSYMFVTVIPPGNSSFTYTPSTTVAISSSKLRGTGEFTLTIT